MRTLKRTPISSICRAALHMARKGVSLWKIAKILGNTLTMVERVYAKHCPDDLRESVGAISGGALRAVYQEGAGQ